MNETIALIPAREGSKGIPDKNIKSLGGCPVINWSVAACLKAKEIDKVIVSTNSKLYSDIAKEAGAEVPFLRPNEISGDESTDTEFILHALDYFESKNILPEYLVHIRPTTPIRSPQIIDKAIIEFKKSSNATSLRSVHEMSESSYKTFEISKERFLRPIAGSKDIDKLNNARQVFPKTYAANGYVDVLSVPFIKKFQLIHGEKVLPFITPYTLEIDTEEDFEMIEYKISLDKRNVNDLFGET